MMNTLTAGIGGVACLALALVSTTQAQEKPSEPPKVATFHQMEIYNGPVRTVHYFSAGASTAERSNMREVERSENEAALADQLLDLRRQYVSNERFLENRRREVQKLYYGYHASYNYGYYGYYSPFAYYAYLGNGAEYWPGLGNGTVSQGLFGVGDEGVIKAAIAQTLAAHRPGLPGDSRLAEPRPAGTQR
jgi:hypothetical protein